MNKEDKMVKREIQAIHDGLSSMIQVFDYSCFGFVNISRVKQNGNYDYKDVTTAKAKLLCELMDGFNWDEDEKTIHFDFYARSYIVGTVWFNTFTGTISLSNCYEYMDEGQVMNMIYANTSEENCDEE